MKKLFCSFIICLLGLLAITSCGNDDEKFEGLEFDTQGVILSTRSGNFLGHPTVTDFSTRTSTMGKEKRNTT